MALRLAGLVANCESVQHNFAALALTPSVEMQTQLAQLIAALAAQVEALCAQSGINPAGLPTPSRRCYQWLRYLSDSDAFADHLDTVTRANAAIGANPKIQEHIALGRGIRFELDHSSHIWRIRTSGKLLILTAAEGYCGAPGEVLEALIALATAKSRQAGDLVRAYARSDDFAEIAMALELMTGDDDSAAHGRHHDLYDIFTQVNRAHFDGTTPRPRRLIWSSRITTRVMGHYQPRSDTVMLSKTLDDPAVPQRVLEFVMYHELLHKRLGVRMSNGRRHAHFAEFRQAEKCFPGFAEIEALLISIARQRRG